MVKRRVVITGIGVISPIGIGKNQYWQSLWEGRSGFRPITLFDTKELKVKIAGEITDFDPKQFLGPKGLRTQDRATTLLSSAVKLALEDTSIQINDENTKDIGIVVGTTFGSVQSIMDFDKKALIDGPLSVNPSYFPNTVINSPASQSAIRFKIKGLNTTVSTGMCASLDAIDYAIDLIRLNKAKIIIVGSVEEMCIQTFLGFYKLNYLSGLQDNSEPISCPFDKRRDGIIFSEGSTAIILEDIDPAKQRKAPIYAEILGIGSYFDPYRIAKYNPNGRGMKEAMRMALNEAGLNPKDIDYICANANSTKEADLIETLAIKEVFSEYAYRIPVSSIKSMVGESFSTSGGLATIASIGAINKSFIPPTINYNERDPRCDLNYVPNKAIKTKIRNVMINTFELNGANTTLIIGKVD
jgi:3-oxoacyl-[acyl-carrier-protein] synthase II